MRKFAKIALGMACLGGTSAAYAHDFFLMPVDFNPQKSGRVEVQATVGSSFPQPDTAVPADRVERLFAVGSGKPRLAVAAAGSKALTLALTGTQRGAVIAAVKTKDRDVEYAEDRIPLILGEYRVSPEAAAAVEALGKPRTLKVVSRRFAKTLLCVQRCGDRAVAMRPLGADLEFVALAGTPDRYRLLSLGKPLSGYPVDLVTSAGKRLHLSSSPEGDVTLPADATGALMLFAAVMTPPRDGDRFTLNLSTLTFSRP